MIDQLITALSKEVKLSAEEIADTIWLALQMQESQSESVSSISLFLKEDKGGIYKPKIQSDQETLPKPKPKTSNSEKAITNQPTEESKASIYPRNQQKTPNPLELPFKVPDAPSMREPLTLARALKPLMRRIASDRESVLDEAATIQQIADEGLWQPVLRPTLEPWLYLELVVDEGISMQIWRHTIRELERLLKNYGIFRDVRVWGLITDEKEQVQIRRGIGSTAKNQSLRSPKELIDPTGRRLVLVVSDCVSSLWRNGEVTSVLELWAKQGSMAIVQMLPKWLWKRTALGRASEVRLRGLTLGVSNQKLIAEEVSLWNDLDEEKGVKVPVFTLEPNKVATWAQMLLGKGSIWTSGYVFKLGATLVKKESDLFNLTHNELSPKERVQAFRVTASPIARKMAGLLASAPVITLPIVRLVREILLKDSQQVHVAEVFLGGLLKPLSEISADTNPDYVQYGFIDGVRELLVDSVPSTYILNVVDEVSKFVAKKLRLSLEEFAAVLKNPQQVRDSEIVEEVGYFATITSQILRRLGGEYAKVADEMEAQQNNAHDITFNYLQSPERAKLNPPNNIPFQGSANFVGRQHELSLLREKLQQPGVVAIYAVSGMVGVGKTKLATQYARQHEADYPGGICWLNARESDLAADILQFARLHMNLEVPQQDFLGRQLSLSEQVDWCWQNWQPAEGLALVVLDDITDLGNWGQNLPRNNRFRVLMTTRLRNLDINIEEISLDVLSPEEALQLLVWLVGERRVQKEEETAKLLCEWLGYLPLGLELVGRYLARKPPNWTLAKMLERLQQQRLQDEAINRHKQQLQKTLSTAQLGVLDAFELSWWELDLRTQGVGELLSLFTPDIFAWEWVESATSRLNWDATEVEIAVDQLYERHFIQSVEDKSGDRDDCYKIHPLIREFLKVKLAASEQVDELKRAFAETFIAIAQEIPQSPTQEIIKSVKDAIPHLAEVAQNLTDAVSNENLLSIFVGLGIFYQGQGLYALAKPWFEQCVSVVQSRLEEEHPDVAASYNNLAELYNSQGRYTDAEPLYIRALELRQRLLGDEHPDVAQSYNNLAELYNSQGRYTDAEPLYIKALEISRRLLGDEHPNVALSYNNLGYFYDSQGRYAEAEPLLIKALELRRRLLGDEHPDVAQSYNNLACLYNSQRRYAEAEPLYIKALEIRRRLLGDEHPDVAASYSGLALVYYSQGRYTEAELLYIKALELRQRLLGDEHPDVATNYNNLAEVYYSQGRYTDAEPLYIKALEIAERRLGVNHPKTITFRENLQLLRDNYA